MSTRMSHLHASSLLLHAQLKAWNLLGSFSHIIASFLLSLYSLHIWYSPPVGLGYYLTSDTVRLSLQLVCKLPKGRKSFPYTQHLLTIHFSAKLDLWGVNSSDGE